MRLFEAIVDANHRALAGDASAGLHPADFADALPVAALTCIDARLNPLFPEVLGLPKEKFIWLRNAGNIITGPLSSTMRSLALACAVKGGKEIAIIGHTDCLIAKTSTMNLTEAFRALGVERSALPENLTEFFGMFASERQNVMKAVEFARHSPIVGPKTPVHGLLVDIQTGKLEWVVNGYQAFDFSAAGLKAEGAKLMDESVDALKSLAAFKMGEMKFPDSKIGEFASDARNWVQREIEPAPKPATAPKPIQMASSPGSPPPPRVPTPPRVPIPPKVPPVAPNIPVPPRVGRQYFKLPKR
jgi:carbonic anhydrase